MGLDISAYLGEALYLPTYLSIRISTEKSELIAVHTPPRASYQRAYFGESLLACGP